MSQRPYFPEQNPFRCMSGSLANLDVTSKIVSDVQMIDLLQAFRRVSHAQPHTVLFLGAPCVSQQVMLKVFDDSGFFICTHRDVQTHNWLFVSQMSVLHQFGMNAFSSVGCCSHRLPAQTLYGADKLLSAYVLPLQSQDSEISKSKTKTFVKYKEQFGFYIEWLSLSAQPQILKLQ